MVCCLAAILLLFTTWLEGYVDGKALDHIPTTADFLKDIFGHDMIFVKIVIVLFFVNIIAKFFDRTAWLSAICALVYGYIHLFIHKAMIEANQSPMMIWSDGRVNLSAMGIIATLVELALVTELFVRFVSWVVELFKKREGKPFVVSMIVWAVLCLALFCIFAVSLKLKGQCEGDTAYEGLMILAMVSAVAFLIFDIAGIVKWLQFKRQDKKAALAATGSGADDQEQVGGAGEQADTKGEEKQEQGRITLRQILLFATMAVIFAPMPFFIDAAVKEDKETPAIVGTVEPEGEDVEVVEDDENYDAEGGYMATELYGSVANYPITMKLYIDGNTADGSYYYDRKGPGETLSLNGTYKDGKLDLYETDASGRQTGHFDGYLDGGEYKGIFVNSNGKRMSFILNDNSQASKPAATTSPAPSADPDAQYVKVTGVNVRLRTTPSINDNNIIKDARGKNVHPYKGERLKMVSEEDEFYLVIYRGDYVYISKQFAVLE